MNLKTDTAAQLLDNLSTAVLLFDENLKLTCINSACEDLLSLSFRRISGQSPYEFLPGATGFADTIKRSLNTGQPYTERSLTLDLSYTNSIIVDCKVTPIVNDGNGAEVIVELVDSYSAQRAFREENLVVLHDAARDSVRGMAHEIKNPLGGIRGAAQLLERELDNKDLIEYTQIIIQESDRLRNFIDRMLASDKKLSLEKANIHEIIEYVSELMQAEFDEFFHFERDYDPSIPDVEVDRKQIVQALINVMRNAIQAIGEGGHIKIRTRSVRQFTIHQHLHKLVVQIDIIDDGPGIPTEIESGIFYPMISGRADGTGLGLSIAQSLIHLHNGIIEYERRGERTIFSIYLPMEQPND
jgi:two-component system nitrogen regulation sensor histidine kinase GlnL